MVLADGISQTRIVNCYLDWSVLDIYNPNLVDITNTFFLGDIFYPSNTPFIRLFAIGNNFSITGLVITQNQFSSYSVRDAIALNETMGSFSNSIYNSRISDNVFGETNPKYSIIKSSTSGSGTWTFDFSNQLLFPQIQSISYSFESSGFIPNVAATITNSVVTIKTQNPVSATVYIEVDTTLPQM